MRIAKRLPANEILKILEQQWLNVREIKDVASVGYAKATSIKQTIEEQIKKDDPMYFIPPGLVPTQKVIDYLHIDINYLRKMAKMDLNKEGYIIFKI